MNREDIDIMWNKALREAIEEGEQFTRYHFAAIVAAAERDRIADEAKHIIKRAEARGAAAERESWPAEMEAMERQVNILTDALAQAKAEEREACAKVCEEHPDGLNMMGGAFVTCAAAIRARGQA